MGSATLGLLEQYLGEAIRQDDWADLLLRLRQGAKLIGADCREPETGHSPLHVAVLYGRAKMVEKLLEKGAEVQAVDWSGKTALQLAVRDQHEEIAKMIVDFDKKAAAKADESNGWTALHYASQYCKGEIGTRVATALLACPEIGQGQALSDAGESALDIGARHDNTSVVLAILQSVEVPSIAMQRALAIAASQGSSSVALLLVKYGADVHIPITLGTARCTPLLCAPTAVSIARSAGHQRLAHDMRDAFAVRRHSIELEELAAISSWVERPRSGKTPISLR